MRVAISEAKCQGHGRCYEIAPEVFTDDDRGYGSVIAPDVPVALTGKAQAAVNVCPERAIAAAD